MIRRGCVAWLLVIAAACSPHTDLVGLLRVEKLCDGVPCPMCGAADSCTTDPRCADASVCVPSMPDGVCEGRTCDALNSRSAFCAREGSPIALGDSCASPNANPRFRFALCSQGDLLTQAPLSVDGDVAVDGRLTSFRAAASIRGTLHYRDMLDVLDDSSFDAPSVEKSSAAQCVLDDALSFDIAAAVKARASDNDNAGAPAALAGLAHYSGDVTLELPCGRYYVSGIEGDGGVKIRALGNVALFVAGNVQVPSGFELAAESGARISLVVAGALHVNGGFQLGGQSDARHFLAVVGQVFVETGDSHIGGAVYVPADELLSTAPLQIDGAVFAGRVKLDDATAIRYAPEQVFAADGCSTN